MKNIYKVLLTVILLYGSVYALAQNRVITGIVKDNEGALPGVSVIERGAPNNGVSTNLDGSFKITLRGSSNVLIIRGIGYVTQDVNVRGKQSVTILLATDAKGLEDVVVIGYGTQKRIAVTGSISTVTREDIQQTPSASLQNSLSGKLPGFSSQQRGGRPGADGADFYIRGVSTYNGTGASTQPLILVDDVPFSYADFQNIDPNEVNSISILKDAATTAPYGVKGANGVVLVTTRRGQVGAARINFRTEFGVQASTYTPKFLDAANTAMLVNEAKKNDFYIANGNTTGFVPTFSQNDIDLYANGSDPYLHPNVDWYNTLFKKTSPINKSNLDISGGTTAVKYFVSVGLENQGGMLRHFQATDGVNNNYDFDRYNFRSNLDINATKSLSFKIDFSGNNTVTNSTRAGSRDNNPTAILYEVYEYEYLNPYIYPIYNPDGSFGFAPSGTPVANNNVVGRLTYGGYDRARQNLLSFNASAIQKLDVLTPGLQAKVEVSITNRTTATSSLGRVGNASDFPSYYYDGNTYTPRNSQIYRIPPYNPLYAAGTPIRQSTVQAHLTYQRSFGKNNVNALFLYNQNTELRNNTAKPAFAYKPGNFRGLTSRVGYNYSNKYILEFNGSYNGSDKFAASHRYGFFPAGSVAYVVSEENFMKNKFRFISLLKFRGSYGIVGSDNLGGFDSFYATNYALGGVYSLGETNTPYTSIIPSSIGSDIISWEKERKLDIGMDFAMFNGKITGTVDAFFNKRSDILEQPQTVAAYFGLPDGNLPPVNIGIVSNKGFEADLTYAGKFNKNISFNLKGNFSYAKNKILMRSEIPPLYPYQSSIGRSIGEAAIFKYDGYYTVAEANDPSVPKFSNSQVGGIVGRTLPGFLKYHDMNGDGIITNDDLAYIGRSNLPTTTVGFSPGLTYKRFSINALFQASFGNDVKVGFVYNAPFRANLQETHLGRWTPETAETATFPALSYDFAGTYMSNSNSEYWSTNGRYLRLKSLELGYRIPEKLINKIGLSGARLYANGYNLITWSDVYNRTGLDAEVANQGLFSDYTGVYPQSAIINVGLNVTFK